MGQSKNSKKGSKPTVIVRPEKAKKKKEEIRLELTQEVYEKFKEIQDLSVYDDGNSKREVLRVERKFGKTYIVLRND